MIEAFCDLFVSRDIPMHIRSDNGQELSRLPFENGLPLSEPRPPTLSPEIRGRTADAKLI